MLSLYENIKALRISNGWDQGYLARLVGYADKSMISRIENGKVDLKQSQIMAFAEVFGVDAGSLFSGLDTGFPITISEKDLIRAYRSAPESRREAVRALLEIPDKKSGSMSNSAS